MLLSAGVDTSVPELLRLADALLLHQQVLKSKPSQAFLKVWAAPSC